MALTAHAQERVRQRFKVCPDEAALLRRWQTGREPTRQDFEYFNTCAMDNCVYRIVIYQGHKWLFSRDSRTGDFVTIFRRR